MPARPNTVTIDANAGLGDAIPRPEKKNQKQQIGEIIIKSV